ncbi:MAG: segregation/condensation protein A [Hyphomicrobiaceae bacterium]|nr:segregation/condensation protein A [Hyphomicrobiaceae bacterium]
MPQPDANSLEALHDGPHSAWGEPERDGAVRAGEDLIIGVDGFEGPLDVLLALARTQKVDLAQISVLALAEQYLAFVERAQALRLELAADYLVMAAWLAYLKSRLLLPRSEAADEQPSGEELAQRLAFRLARLEAMRNAARQLMALDRFGRDVFGRGMPEAVRRVRDTRHTARLFDLLKAYADQRVRALPRQHVVRKRTVWSIKDARVRLERMLGGEIDGWVQLDLFLEHLQPSPEISRTVLASSLGAALELAREGRMEIRQDKAFGPIHLRRQTGGPGDVRT